MKVKQEIYSITMLRGIACLGVCIMHFSGTIDSKNLHEITKYGGYGVPIFFAISGFILPYSLDRSSYQIRDFFPFILKRIIRLEPSYIISILGLLLLSMLAQFSKFNSSDQIDFVNYNNLLHIFYLVDVFDGKWLNPAYWTLAIEFQFYLFIGIIYPLLRSNNVYVLTVSFVILNLLTLLVANDHYVPYFFSTFLSGIILFWYTSKRITLRNFLIFSAILGFLSFYKYGISGPICEILSITFILFMNKPIKPLIFLGTISYSLYLIHTIIGTDGIINFMQNYILDENGRIWLSLVTFPIVVAISWVLYLLIERPSIRMSKKIKYKLNIANKT